MPEPLSVASLPLPAQIRRHDPGALSAPTLQNLSALFCWCVHYAGCLFPLVSGRFSGIHSSVSSSASSISCNVSENISLSMVWTSSAVTSFFSRINSRSCSFVIIPILITFPNFITSFSERQKHTLFYRLASIPILIKNLCYYRKENKLS